MKSDFIIVDHSKFLGGGQKSLLEFVNYDLPFEIEFLIHNSNKHLIKNIQKKKKVQTFKNYFHLGYLIFKKREIRNFYANTFGTAFVLSLFSYIFKLKIIFRARLAIQELSHGIVDKIILKRAKIIICNSEYVKNGFINLDSDSINYSKKLHTIYNYIDAGSKINKEKFHSQLDSENATFIVIGSYDKNKNHELLIDGINGLDNIFIDCFGNITDQVNYQRLKQLVSKNSLKISMNGFTDLKSINWSKYHALINTSKSEALNRSIVEAMQKGIPVIASNIPGNILLVGKNEERGLLFDLDNPSSLKETITRFLQENKNHREKRIELAKDFAITTFDRNNTTLQEIECIRSIFWNEQSN